MTSLGKELKSAVPIAVVLSLATIIACTAFIPVNIEPFSFDGASVAPGSDSRALPADRGETQYSEGKVLDIRLRSASNLSELAERRRLNVWISTWFCDTGDALFLRSASGLLYKDAKVNYIDVPVKERERVRALLSEVPERQQKIYHFHLDVKGNLRDDSSTSRSPYDLEVTPKDVCVTVRGGGYITKGFTSNVVVIPADAIRAAFAARR
jgi:hypothetical protein